MSKPIEIDSTYKQWLAEIKEHIRSAQIKAALSVNSEMLSMYYDLGKRISSIKADTRWGGKFYHNLSIDLKVEFPDIQGFSETNLRYIVKFYRFYSDGPSIPPQVGEKLMEWVTSIPWGHQKLLIDKCKSVKEALFYIEKCRKNGWSRNVLMNNYESNLFNSEGRAVTNFTLQLPNSQSDLAQQTLKDPYNFDFLAMRQGYNERELEDALTTNITKFLIELGSGFSYIGRQQRILVGESEFFIDLLFYHIKLRCFVVVELKTGEFRAEYVSKLGLYVSAVNHQMKHTTDQPTIGLLICKNKDVVVAQYTLESTNQPIGISEYQLKGLYPEKIDNEIPSIEELEREFEKIDNKKQGLKKLHKYHFFYGSPMPLEACWKKNFGLAIAMKKFEEFQEHFTLAQYSFEMGMKDDHKVSSSDGNNDSAQNGIRSYYLKNAIQYYNACYDYILQIVYFGCDFNGQIDSIDKYKDELKKCVWSSKKKKEKEKEKENNEKVDENEELGFKDIVDKIIKNNKNDIFSVFLRKLRIFYEYKNNHYLADWTNKLKHKGDFIVDELFFKHNKVEIWNKRTKKMVFSTDYIEPQRISFDEIKECLTEHNNRIVDYAEFLYSTLGFEDPVSSEKLYTANHPQNLDTTDWEIRGIIRNGV